MSGGSGSQNASGMNAPVLNGYAVTWDYDTREWAARKGDSVLRGGIRPNSTWPAGTSSSASPTSWP